MTRVPVPWELVLPQPAPMPLSFLPSEKSKNVGHLLARAFLNKGLFLPLFKIIFPFFFGYCSMTIYQRWTMRKQERRRNSMNRSITLYLIKTDTQWEWIDSNSELKKDQDYPRIWTWPPVTECHCPTICITTATCPGSVLGVVPDSYQLNKERCFVSFLTFTL